MKKFVNTRSRSTFRYPFPERFPFNMERVRYIIKNFWKLNRTAVNKDTDKLCDFLVKELGADVIEAQPGEQCLTWRIPKHWHVREAYIAKMDGTRIVDFRDNPLHLWTHSISYNGIVYRDELLKKHVASDPNRPDEFPYHFHNGYRHDVREWGFSIPYNLVQQMKDEKYIVYIDADLNDFGTTLKVVDACLPGKMDDTIFIMAHTCHPAIVSDGLGCIAIAVEIFHWLKKKRNRKYTYRFIFGPEYFAAATYLSKAPTERIKSLRFGMYLDMLTTSQPIGFQYSAQGNSLIDKITRNIMRSHNPSSFEKPYRELWGNDELFYNGPGFEIPCVGIGRAMHREYHYNTDNLDYYQEYSAKEAIWIISRIIDVFEKDYVPKRLYDGPLYRSLYNLDSTVVDLVGGAKNFELIQCMMNAKLSWFDIADRLDIDAYAVYNLCETLFKKGLIQKLDRTLSANDKGEMSL